MIYKDLIKNRPGLFVLLDPDKIRRDDIDRIVEMINSSSTSAILIGTSLLLSPDFDDFVRQVKKVSKLPVIIFPGGSNQVSKYADAIFFLSLLSGRNPQFLIGDQVRAAPLIKKYNLEPISVGYILAGSKRTSVGFMSATLPIPQHKPELIVAHALAGYYLGMKFIYLDAGSGSETQIQEETIRMVKREIEIPLIVGGGIRRPSQVKSKIEAGADFIVIGNVLEEDYSKIEEFSKLF